MSRGCSRGHPLTLTLAILLVLSTLQDISSPAVFALAATTNSQNIPRIDYDALGSVSIIGAFSSLELYDPDTSYIAPVNSSSSHDSLLSIDHSGQAERLGSVNGSIHAVLQCGQDEVYFGGAFTVAQDDNTTASNIAVYNLRNNSITSLQQGLDGTVHALTCDEDAGRLYAAGTFSKPIGAASEYRGAVAAWDLTARSWSALAFGGFPGEDVAIYSMAISNTSDATKSLLFGGDFTTYWLNASTAATNVTVSTANNGTLTISASNGTTSDNSTASVFPSLGSSLVPIALTSAEISSSSSSSDAQYSDPRNILCPAGADGEAGSTWLAQDSVTGRITARLFTPLETGGFRIGNTNVNGDGVETFSITAIPTNEVLTLSYRDEPTSSSSSLSSCSTACPLSHDASVSYEDFLIAGTSNGSTTITGFELTVQSYYGSAGGLHLLQLLSSGSISYSIDTQNDGYGQGVCSSGPYPVYGRSSSTLQRTETIPWNHHEVPSSAVAGTSEGMVCAPTPVDTDAEDSAVATWYPYIAQDGTYDISFFTPACGFDATCGQRGYVDIAVEISGDGTSSSQTTTINQEVEDDTWSSVYSGAINPLSENQQVKVTMRLSSSQRATLAEGKGDKYYLIADKILIIAQSTDGQGSTEVKVGSGATAVNVTTQTGQSLAYTRGYGLWGWQIGSTEVVSPTLDSSSLVAQTVQSLSTASTFEKLSFGFSGSANVTKILMSSDGAFTFIAGDFNSTTTGLAARSILIAGDILTKVPHGGLAGSVTDMAVLDGYLYVVGDFNASADGTITGLNGKAKTQYASLPGTWEALTGFSSDKPAKTVTVVEDNLLFTYEDSSPDIWSPANSTVLAAASTLTVGTFDTAVTSTNGSSVFLGGQISSLNQVTANSLAMLSSKGIEAGNFTLSSASTTESYATFAASSTSAAATESSTSSQNMLAAFENRLRKRQSTSPVLEVPTSLPTSFFSTSDPRITAAAFWQKSDSEQVTILGGSFTANDGAVSNLALLTSDGLLHPLSTGGPAGTVLSLLVSDNTLWVSGNFTASPLATYDLESETWTSGTTMNGGLQPSTASVDALFLRDKSIIVGGSFSELAGVACRSVCEYDTAGSSWKAYGDGVSGIVSSMTGSGSALFVAGSFVVNNTSSYIQMWDYDTSTWSSLSSDTLPGPALSITADTDSNIFVSGVSSSGSASYLMRWTGSTWTSISGESAGDIDTTTSSIQQVALVPLASDVSDNNNVFSTRDRGLLVSGQLVLADLGSVSSALFDGASWYPYLLSTAQSGGSGVVAGLFSSNANGSWSQKHHLAVGLVILISIAIALGIIFLCVLITLIITLNTRQDDPQAYPIPIVPPYDPKYVAGPHSASPLPYAAAFAAANQEKSKGRISTGVLETLGAATAALSAGHPHAHPASGAAAMARDRNLSNDSRLMSSSEEDSMYDQEDVEEGDNSLPMRGARYSFEAERDEELSLSAGDTVEILDDSDEHWHIVRRMRDGRQGLVPSAFLT